jgi:tuberculosinol/isotuberculosinol synthase
MITFEHFLQLPTREVAALVKASGRKVCAFAADGTRRWFVLEHADKIKGDFAGPYLHASVQNQVDLCTMLFDHGIDTLLVSMFGYKLLYRGDEYIKRVTCDGIALIATDPIYRAFYERYNVKVGFYGEYSNAFTGTPYEHALKSIAEITQATRQNTSFRLYYGAFADHATDITARLAVEHYRTEGSIPDQKTLIRKYYGDDLEPISLFIGFDRFHLFDIPLLTTGLEDLYFSLSPSPYMTQTQLRAILYDHLYVRNTPEPDYTKLPKDEQDWLRDYYRENKDYAFGVGKIRSNIWIPVQGSEK